MILDTILSNLQRSSYEKKKNAKNVALFSVMWNHLSFFFFWLLSELHFTKFFFLLEHIIWLDVKHSADVTFVYLRPKLACLLGKTRVFSNVRAILGERLNSHRTKVYPNWNNLISCEDWRCAKSRPLKSNKMPQCCHFLWEGEQQYIQIQFEKKNNSNCNEIKLKVNWYTLSTRLPPDPRTYSHITQLLDYRLFFSILYRNAILWPNFSCSPRLMNWISYNSRCCF